MSVLIHRDTLDYLNYCYEQFMTILLTFCFTEAGNCIININEYYSTKYKYNNNNMIDIDSDIENNENLLHENYKLEGRIFSDSSFFKRYSSKLYELKNKIQANSVENTNKYYTPAITEYITNHYIPFVSMWSALLLKIITPENS